MDKWRKVCPWLRNVDARNLAKATVPHVISWRVASVNPCLCNLPIVCSKQFCHIPAFMFSLASWSARARHCAFCCMIHFWCLVMLSLFSSSRFPATVRNTFELLLTWQTALILLSVAARTVNSEASSGLKSNLTSGESQYVSRRGGGDVSNEGLTWLRGIMVISFVTHSESPSSPSSDDAKRHRRSMKWCHHLMMVLWRSPHLTIFRAVYIVVSSLLLCWC